MKGKVKNNFTHDAGFFLNVILNETDDAIIFTDADGYITALSYAYAEFLGVNRSDVIGKHVTDVIENTRMQEVVKSGKPEIAQTQNIRGQKMIASRIPIIVDGEIKGAFGRVLFKSMSELDSLYKRINKLEKKLNFYESNFVKANSAKYKAEDIIGHSPAIMRVKENIKRVAQSNSNVLILGESGTGKELAAHAIHCEKWGGTETKHPFVCVNCAAIPTELMESELFGYEEGAFTGAKGGGKIGMFQAANGGTLFLDEIGELPIHMQIKLLRVLQEKKVQKIGSVTAEDIDVRIIAATNRDLYKMTQEKLFREDLYFRLNVITFLMPPLRERREDIPLLAMHLLEKMSGNSYINVKAFSPEAIKYLKEYHWPGNVRELENAIERAVNFVGESGVIELGHIKGEETISETIGNTKTLKKALEDMEKDLIVNAIAQCKGHKGEAARSLGFSRTSLYEKMDKYSLGK